MRPPRVSPAYEAFAPPPALAHLVDAFWRVALPARSPASEEAPVPPAAAPSEAGSHRVLPDGCVDLVVRVQRGAAEAPVTLVSGPAERCHLVALVPGTEFVGVRFRPGAAPGVLGVRPEALVGRVEAAAACAPAVPAHLAAQVLAAATGDAALDVVRRAVVVLAAGGAGGPPARVAAALPRLAAGAGVRAVAAALGVSERTLHRDVVGAVGLAPKVFTRVARFRTATRLLRAAPPARLSDVALAAGYADQAHMTREVRAFAGLPPRALARQHPD